MDYEKLHKAALEIGEELIKKSPEMKDWVVSLLPELKESEEERIRKNLIKLFKDMEWDDSILHDYYLDKDKTIAWLEKQGNKPNNQLDETSYQAGIKRVLDNPESYGLCKSI